MYHVIHKGWNEFMQSFMHLSVDWLLDMAIVAHKNGQKLNNRPFTAHDFTVGSTQIWSIFDH